MRSLTEPRIIEHAPYQVVGAYCAFDGDDEGPGWTGAYAEFDRRRNDIRNRKDNLVLGFLYWPHRDHPEVPEAVRSCFVGVDVADLDAVPAGLSVTRFSGGQYVTVESHGDTSDEAAEGVGAAISFLEQWLPAHGYAEGDACFACSDESAPRPPFVERVYIKLEKKA